VFAFRDSRGPVDVAFTDRAGGVSGEPYTSLNLAAAAGPDDPGAVAENMHRALEAFAGSADASVALMHQVHGAAVAVVAEPGLGDVTPGPAVAGLDGLAEVDGLVTALPGVTLVVRVADCVPVLLADLDLPAVGALHAGRPGLVAGIVPAGVAAMRRLGARRLLAWVGPHVCGRCYEVPADMRDEVAAMVPAARAETSWGTPAVDVGAGVRAQLVADDVEVVDASRCTREHSDLFSYGRARADAAMTPDPARRDELAASLARVESRIGTACAEAGRPREEVTLVVVTKFFPASDVRLLHELGVRHVGENRHQEAAAKQEECADLELRWHFVGGLQSNKAAAVGGWADVVQSVDRSRLLPGLSRTAVEKDRVLDVLIQVSLDPTPSSGGRNGCPPEQVASLAREVAATPGLRLRGVMGVAPLGGAPDEAFEVLGRVRSEVARELPEATWMSAGMSGDLEAAVACGATHVRVGTAVLGKRPTRV
jgi:pyridoxal phosphate enzyme (YggS family)/YfiH family protein